MRPELLFQLAEADEIDILELTKALEVSNWLRSLERDHAIAPIEMAKRLHLSISHYRALKNGCYSLNLRMISHIQMIERELILLTNKKKKITPLKERFHFNGREL